MRVSRNGAPLHQPLVSSHAGDIVAQARNANRDDQPDSGHKDLKMTMRYAAVMPPLLRQEFETAFAQIDEEHRATAQVRVLLSPEAHIAAQVEWRESLFVDLGIGWCGLTAYHPCETRLACQSCPNLIPDKESLPLLERQRANLIELRGLANERLLSTRREEVDRELTTAIDGIECDIARLSEK
jgi:hypothetical protein